MSETVRGSTPPAVTVSDAEVLEAMLSFTTQGCDDAHQKWCEGRYTPGLTPTEAHPQIREAYYRFEAIKRRARQFINKLKREHRDGK